MILKDELVKFGLTNKEASVYLACLELGIETVNTIAKESGVFRTYCYDILESLLDKGLVTTIQKKGIHYYEAIDPDRFLTIIEEKKSHVESIIPQLKALQSTKESRPKTRFFEGKEGIKAIHDDILKEGEDTLVMGSLKIRKSFGFAFDSYIKSRVKKGIRAKVIMERGKETNDLIKNSRKELREVRIIKNINQMTNVYIYGNKVALITWGKELFGTVIEDKETARTHRFLFETLWNSAEHPPSNTFK